MPYNFQIAEQANVLIVAGDNTTNIGSTAKTYSNLGYSHEGVVDTIAVAQAGVLTTRTDINTGVITMDSVDHTVQTGDKVVVFWDVDGVVAYQFIAVVGTVSGVTVPIDNGAGTDLPAALTAVRVSICQSVPFVVTNAGNELVGLTVSAQRAGLVLFTDSVDDPIDGPLLQTGGGDAIYADSKNSTYPIGANTTTSVWFFNADSVNTNIMRVDAVFNPVA